MTSLTLDLLEERLRQVDYMINGNNAAGESEGDAGNLRSGSQAPAATRLRHLTRMLDHLASKHAGVAQVLELQERRPDLFRHSSAAVLNPNLPMSVLSDIVLAHEQTYRTLSAQLQQLQNLKVPDTAHSAHLVNQRQRIAKVRTRQLEQMEEMQELRNRSARVLEFWYEGGVLGMGEMWAQLEARVRACEIAVRRVEAAKRREDDEGEV